MFTKANFPFFAVCVTTPDKVGEYETWEFVPAIFNVAVEELSNPTISPNSSNKAI